MILYLWIAIGSALGGCLRYALGRAMVTNSTSFPWSTLLINFLGSFVIGFFGTLTLTGSRFAVPETVRLFIMVGICGSFTTFSSFSLQTFDLIRAGDWGRAVANVVLSVLLCLGAVALGHMAALPGNDAMAITQTADEECAS